MRPSWQHISSEIEVERCPECGGVPEGDEQTCHCVVPDGIDRPLCVEVVGSARYEPGYPPQLYAWNGPEPGALAGWEVELVELRCGDWRGAPDLLTESEQDSAGYALEMAAERAGVSDFDADEWEDER